jgi:2,4-dienoyl-CoA reductase-like NADH-dependent reductase (Old Yellow Enzyme family)
MDKTPRLFTPLTFRSITVKNRIFVSPMCQYSAKEGVANHWHLVHLGSRASGGAGLVMVEATAVNPEGRISGGDLGIWNDQQVQALAPIAEFIRSQGSVPAIQLAHAGRKGAGNIPWLKADAPENVRWSVVGPSEIPFSEDYQTPKALSKNQISELIADFVQATKNSLVAGFEVVEIHMAHGYLFHQFLSPLSNLRTDEYGGSLENRMRFPLEAAKAMRAAWPNHLPMFVRISVTDWAESGGWDLEQSLVLAQELKGLGIDLIDCSSGGTLPHAKIPVAPGYQVPFSEEIRKKVNIPTGAVGMITDGKQAEAILAEGRADVVLLAREFLRNPYFPIQAAKDLGFSIEIPKQYGRSR